MNQLLAKELILQVMQLARLELEAQQQNYWDMNDIQPLQVYLSCRLLFDELNNDEYLEAH